MNRKLIGVFALLMTFGWMLLIFGFSSQSGEESGGLSGVIAEPLTELLDRLSGGLAAGEKDALYLKVDGAVRSAAHFSEYAVLGLLLTVLLRCVRIRGIWLPWLIGVAYAVTDEWHQSFSPGRVCDVNDVLIDACGVFCGAIFCKMIIQQWRKKHVHDS